MPLSTLLGAVTLALLWHRLWADGVPPLALRRWQVEGIRQGARRLGLPAPDVGPDGVPAPRRLTVKPIGKGPFQVALWRSTLHLIRRRRWLVVSLAALPLLGSGIAFLAAPSADVDPLVLRGLPFLFAQFWSTLLVLLGPDSPAALPLEQPLATLARVLPAATWLGLLSGVGAAVSAAGPGTVCAALLSPGAALVVLAWLGQTSPGGPVTPASLRFAAAALPGVVVSLCGAVWGGWLAPLLLLGLGFAVVWLGKL